MIGLDGLPERQRVAAERAIERLARRAATTAAGLRHVAPEDREEVYQAAYARVSVYLTLAVADELADAAETGGEQ